MLPWVEVFRRASDGAVPLVMALATVDAAGAPRVRSVVCRKIDEDGSVLFASDSRSDKHDHLTRDPRAEAVCWLPTVREQFRFAGVVELAGESTQDRLRNEVWRSMEARSRAIFYWPAPGTSKASATNLFPQSVEAAEPPANFELLVLHPQMVERLELSPHPHQRTRWRITGNWLAESVNP